MALEVDKEAILPPNGP